MADLTVFGMPLYDYIKLVLILAPIWGVLLAIFVTLGERHWKGMAEELDQLAGPRDDLSDGDPWEIFKLSVKNAWRRDLWLPLAVLRALLRRKNG